MDEFSKILRKMKPVEYIKIGHWTFWKTSKGKFCIDGEDVKKAMTQKAICKIYEYYIKKNDYRLI